MRGVAIGLAAVAAVALGWLQATADLAVRQRAAPGSWVGLVPPAAADRFVLASGALLRSPALALLLARRALEKGSGAEAAERIARLPPSADRAALEGALAEGRGDGGAAVRAYLAAGDLDGLERAIARVERTGRIPEALALQQAVVARLRADPAQSESLARAYLALGRMEETQAYQFAPGDARRYRHELQSGSAYARALALAPYDERALIAAGNQALNLGDLASAERYFIRAQDANPVSASAFVGLAAVALRRGDRAAAASDWERARRIAPASADVVRLGRKLGR
jgi:tetratricopeptide (TPR) repeat protein